MAALEFNAFYHTLVVLLSALVPGVALGWPLLKKTDLSFLEKLALSFFIGMVASPTMLIFENIIGLKFSLFLVFVNTFLLTAAGVFLGIRNGAFGFKMPPVDLDAMVSFEFAKKHAASFFLLIAILLSFWLRIQTYSPIYSELDPYFYIYGTGQIIRFGEAPPNDDTAWWPELKETSHRSFPPLKMYIEAQWYALYTSGGEYDNYLLFVTSSWLQPLSAALAAFGAYLLFASYYGKRYGVLAAYLIAFLPILIFKMSAGVNEAAPFGIATVFMTLGIFAYAVKKSSLDMGALSGVALFACVLGSNFQPLIAIPAVGFVVLQSVDYFVRQKKHGQFMSLSLSLLAGLVFGNVIYRVYTGGFTNVLGIFSGTVVLAIGALAFGFGAEYFSEMKLNQKKRMMLIVAGIVASLLLLFIPNPLGQFAKDQVSSYLGFAAFNRPLERTIAEQNLAGSNFEGEAGFLALIPSAHMAPDAKDIPGIVWNSTYQLLDLPAGLFSLFGNAALKLSDILFNIFLQIDISSGTKDNSLLFVFLIVATVGMLLGHFLRKSEARDVPSIAIFVLLLILPISYIGLNKIKFTLFVGLALAVAAVATFAEIERFLLWIAVKLKRAESGAYVRYAFVGLIALLVLAQATIPSTYTLMILSKSFETRYQDNPQALMPKLAKTCEDLRAVGYYDQEICDAGYNASFADNINSQFNSKVCLVSQLSMKELIPGSSAAEQQASAEGKAGASFRCNRLADYWIDSMEWINKNLEPTDRVTSWWDYGHWINYFGDRKTVLRNEHASKGMIGRVAHDYIDGTTQDMVDSMNYFDSRYVLFDVELIGGGAFGGKYGALNYLSCAHDNKTSERESPGTSDCEFEHLWETVAIPKVQTAATSCVISESQQRTGVAAFRMTRGMVPESSPSYCVGGELTLANGDTITPMYKMGKLDENGDLILNRGFLRNIGERGDASFFEVLYTGDQLWPDGKGGFTGGLEDATTKFYTSNLYRGFYLKSLPGFELVYESKGGEVKIYRMISFTGNKEGYVDPVSAAKTQ